MDAAEIEVFLTLAEELHFTRTAQRLRLPQSRVSRLVASLERRVGGRLFERTSRRVTLTPLGEQLCKRVAPAWSELQAALDEARERARGIDGALRIGCTVTASGPVLSRLVEEFCAQNPDCDLTLHEVSMWDPYTPLRQGEVDVLVNWQILDEPDLVAGPVIEHRDRVLAVGPRHRLAARGWADAEDLGDELTHELPVEYPAAIGDAIVPRFTPSGRPIRRTLPAGNAQELIALVARELIVHPTMAGIALFHRDDVVLIPLAGLPPMPLGLIWCTAHENARIRAFAAAAEQIAQQLRAAQGGDG